MRLISSAAPGLRNYVLNPEWNTSPELWNYPRDPDPALPKRSDFAVRGMIAGPGCPGVTPPVEEPSYAGTPAEAENINELLTYITPLQNRLQTGDDSVTFTIVYSPDIDASTFKAEPGWLRKLFTPSPGTRETVQIPVRGKKQKFMLEVHPLGTTDAVRKHDELDHSTRDRDDFEIRATTTEAGNEKK